MSFFYEDYDDVKDLFISQEHEASRQDRLQQLGVETPEKTFQPTFPGSQMIPHQRAVFNHWMASLNDLYIFSYVLNNLDL